MILSNPFFWALFSLGGILASTAIATSHAFGDRLSLRALAGLLFIGGGICLAAPWCPQARFDLGGRWNLIAGLAVLAVAGLFAVSGSLALAHTTRFAGLWTHDLYDLVRNPIYLGELLFAAGAALIFGSWIGLGLLPLWAVGFTVPVAIKEQRLKRTLGRTYLEYKRRVPGRFIPRWVLPRARPLPRFPYKNLVFKGGGMRGIAYVGALEVLDDAGVLAQIERVAGTSVGAITATLVSFRLDLPTTLALMDSLDYAQVPQVLSSAQQKRRLYRMLHLLPQDVPCWERLLNEYGWYSSDYAHAWLEDIIAQQCGGNGRATFADVRQCGHRDLHVVASNLTKRRAEVFSYRTTPQVAVADAVRLSMSIPLYFQALRFDGQHLGAGDYYVDGGVFNNFPIQAFDAPEYAVDNPWYDEGANWETLGCFLYPANDSQDQALPHNLIEYLRLTMGILYDASQMQTYDRNLLDQRRTVKISDCGVASTDFDIAPQSAKYLELLEAGRRATREFLERHTL